jgi:hypothetical protein
MRLNEALVATAAIRMACEHGGTQRGGSATAAGRFPWSPSSGRVGRGGHGPHCRYIYKNDSVFDNNVDRAHRARSAQLTPAAVVTTQVN